MMMTWEPDYDVKIRIKVMFPPFDVLPASSWVDNDVYVINATLRQD